MRAILVPFTALLALLFVGCVGVQPYPYASDAFSYQPAPVQYAPPQQVVVTPPVGCIPQYYPVWNGCALPVYRPQYFAPMYDYPLLFPQLWLNFNFGGKHHRGGGHHRGR